jgi:hypothetical protein
MRLSPFLVWTGNPPFAKLPPLAFPSSAVPPAGSRNAVHRLRFRREMIMFFSTNAARGCRRWMALLLLAVAIPCTLTGCSQLSLHKSPPPQQLPSNPWIKPAKPETFGEKFRGFFWTETKPKEPKDWLNQKRLE